MPPAWHVREIERHVDALKRRYANPVDRNRERSSHQNPNLVRPGLDGSDGGERVAERLPEQDGARVEGVHADAVQQELEEACGQVFRGAS